MKLQQAHQNAHISQQELTDGRSAAPSLEVLDHQQPALVSSCRSGDWTRKCGKKKRWRLGGRWLWSEAGGCRSGSSEKTTTGTVYSRSSVGMSAIFNFQFLFLFCFSFILESVKKEKENIKKYIFPLGCKKIRGK